MPTEPGGKARPGLGGARRRHPQATARTGARAGRSTALHDAALRAAARGWPVFPLWPGSKKPALTEWEKAATTEPDMISRWWRYAPYNIAVACGRANLVVIDLDQRHGQPPPEFTGARGGADVLEILAARAGQPASWDTYTVATPAGLHLYFTAPPGMTFTNTAGAAGGGLGWCVDTRARGGYVVGEGSVQPEGRYRAVTTRPVAELPPWLARALNRAQAAPARDTANGPAAVELQRDLSAYVRAIVEGEAAAVRAAAPGTRNHILNRAAWTLGRLVAGGKLSEMYARVALEHAATHHIGTDGFTATEARRTIESGLTAGQRRPRCIERQG